MSSRFHKWASIAWFIVGGAITWKYPDSVPWVAFMSLYANIVGHWSSYEAAAAKEQNDDR